MMGMDASILGLLAMTSVGLTMAAKSLWPLAFGTLAGLAVRLLFAWDPLYFAAYARYCREADAYDPWA